jgi:hypothetical protein
VTDRKKMEGYCSTGQSPQRAVVPMEKKKRIKIVSIHCELSNHSFPEDKTTSVVPICTNSDRRPQIPRYRSPGPLHFLVSPDVSGSPV